MSLARSKPPSAPRCSRTDAICLELGRQKSLRERPSGQDYWCRNSHSLEPRVRIFGAPFFLWIIKPIRGSLVRKSSAIYRHHRGFSRSASGSSVAVALTRVTMSGPLRKSGSQWSGHPSYAAQRVSGSSTLPLFSMIFCTELQIAGLVFSHWTAAGVTAKWEYLVTNVF